MLADLQTWKRLLDPLGIVIFDAIEDCFPVILMYKHKHLVVGMLDSSKIVEFGQWHSIEDLEKNICAQATHFVVQGEDTNWFIQNPYLGAKSLEELEIRKDLAVSRDE